MNAMKIGFFVKKIPCAIAWTNVGNFLGKMSYWKIGKNKHFKYLKTGAGYAIAAHWMLTAWPDRTRTPRTLNSSTFIFGAIEFTGSSWLKQQKCSKFDYFQRSMYCCINRMHTNHTHTHTTLVRKYANTFKLRISVLSTTNGLFQMRFFEND